MTNWSNLLYTASTGKTDFKAKHERTVESIIIQGKQNFKLSGLHPRVQQLPAWFSASADWRFIRFFEEEKIIINRHLGEMRFASAPNSRTDCLRKMDGDCPKPAKINKWKKPAVITFVLAALFPLEWRNGDVVHPLLFCIVLIGALFDMIGIAAADAK